MKSYSCNCSLLSLCFFYKSYVTCWFLGNAALIILEMSYQYLFKRLEKREGWTKLFCVSLVFYWCYCWYLSLVWKLKATVIEQFNCTWSVVPFVYFCDLLYLLVDLVENDFSFMIFDMEGFYLSISENLFCLLKPSSLQDKQPRLLMKM